MLVRNEKQGTQEWLDLRASHYTASEAPAMMGASKYQSRQQLLAEKATGIREEITPRQQAIFDKGHAAEAGARPIIEKLIGEELYPVVATQDDLLASFDGLTIDDAIVFEHKLWNAKVAESVMLDQENGTGLEDHYCYQLEQQLYISGAEKAIFVCSDGTEQNMAYCWYTSNPEKREALLAGWEQFKKDLAEFRPVEHKPESKGVALLELPALVVQIAGEVTTSNLPAFRNEALGQIEAINTDLQTDQDFANAEATVKHFTKAEKELEAAKKQAMAQTADIDSLFRTIDQLKDTMRSKRLELDKLVKARKTAIKQEIIVEAQSSFNEHVEQINLRLPVCVPPVNADFAGAIKGKKTVKSIREAVADTLASAKIEVTNYRKIIEENHDLLEAEINGRGYDFLFRDLQQILLMYSSHLSLLIKDRIASHEQAEAARLEAERERIRQEEERKAREEAARLAEIERQRIAEEERQKLEAEQAAETKRKQEQNEAALQQARMAEQELNAVAERRQRESQEEQLQMAIPEPEPVHCVPEATVTIPVSEYEALKRAAFKLQCLEDAGVDNWSGGYDFAMEAFHNEYPIR
ncbi:YqaJ viral recombinase family protein [Salinisphaera sp. G21_0]|uniref:YqaJ viral recombinase family protein n=1 Tax=Salinisphaera sp. G21_0 TaxID=2821094 RepID=UPI001ADC97E8|nr:YqaJ viral recombinase family protein [Salinisphaera sp. G21_0]MBO9484329.1 YqaJ viral recombinase family protein [Salinisphaera sp. G21_0]